MSKEKLSDLQNFKNHLELTLEEITNDFIFKGKPYNEKFNTNITVNGKSIEIDLNADCFENLSSLIQTEIDYHNSK